MFKRLARLIVLVAAVQILGGHWLALQSAAWIGMLASYSREQTLVVALEKTFGGENPCGLCKVVKSGREDEQTKYDVKLLVKLDAVLPVATPMAFPLVSRWKYFTDMPLVAGRVLSPPTPPPQLI